LLKADSFAFMTVFLLWLICCCQGAVATERDPPQKQADRAESSDHGQPGGLPLPTTRQMKRVVPLVYAVSKPVGMDRLVGGCVVARLWTLALRSAGSLSPVRLAEKRQRKDHHPQAVGLSEARETSQCPAFVNQKIPVFAGLQGRTSETLVLR
jgi:hypothetical protein